MAPGGGRGAARWALRSSATGSGRSRTIATAGRRCRRATFTSSARAQSSTLVASTTVRRPRRRRSSRMRWRRSKASSVAPWTAGSSVIIARIWSEERTSVGAKWVRANVLLPLAATPISRTSASAGSEIAWIADRPPRSSAVGGEAMKLRSALGVAVRAHLRLGNRGLRRADGAGKGAAADRGAGLTDQVDLAEVAIRQAPRHITTLLGGGRGHRAELRLRKAILPEIALFHKPDADLAAWSAT